jgi:hypothetical protein
LIRVFNPRKPGPGIPARVFTRIRVDVGLQSSAKRERALLECKIFPPGVHPVIKEVCDAHLSVRLREVQKEVFPDHVDFRIREEKGPVPQMQERECETADYIVSNRYFQKELKTSCRINASGREFASCRGGKASTVEGRLSCFLLTPHHDAQEQSA